jgi:hypothetical protein
MMTLDQLEQQLLTEGYVISERGPRLLSVGDVRLDANHGSFVVGLTERGEMLQTYISTDDEDAACRCLHEQVAGRSWHLATFEDRARVEALGNALVAAGILVIRNDIAAFNGPNTPRYRIFVPGPALQQARRIALDARSA